MASTVYYGKSVTAADVQAKVVKLQLTQEELSRLQEELSQDGTVVEENLLFNSGDELVVHFAHANEVDYPSLVLSIGDSNEEISISTDNGKSIHSNSPTPAVAGCWDSGEVVTFVYTVSETLVGAVASNEAYWVMDDGGIADRDTYGVSDLVDTEIDSNGSDEDKAITVRGVRSLIQNLKGNQLYYENLIGNESAPIGKIQLRGDGITDGEHIIYGPNLTGYATENWVNQKGYITAANLNEYATQDWVTGRGYITASALNGYSPTTHTHATSIQTYSGTPSIALAHGGKYSISAGGTSYSFSLPTVSISVPHFKIVPIYTKNIYYSSAGSNKPTSVNYNGAHGSDSAETYIKGGGGITIDQLIEVAVPSYSGYRFAGVVGYNVNEAGKKTDNTEWTHKNPGAMNVWCCAPNNSYTRVRLEMTNQATTANCVYLTIYLLYISNSFIS